jgi:hypothetical protein
MNTKYVKVMIVLASQCAAWSYAGENLMGTKLTSIVQPGFYGRVDVSNAPLPPLVYSEPVLITPSGKPADSTPIYLHVPPAHAKNWQQHCAIYQACNQPVNFVKSGEYLRDKHYSSHEHEHDYETFRFHGNSRNSMVEQASHSKLVM